MPPMISITRRPAEAGIYPSVRWWAVALLDRSTFVGNYLYIMDETSHYRCSASSEEFLSIIRAQNPVGLHFSPLHNFVKIERV